MLRWESYACWCIYPSCNMAILSWEYKYKSVSCIVSMGLWV